MNIIVLSYLPSIVGIGLLGAVTYLNNPRARVNKTFALFTAVVSTWLFALLLTDTASSDVSALWFLRIALAIGSALGTAFIIFADSFPAENERTLNDFSLKVLWAATVLFAIFSFTDYMIPSVANSQTESTLGSMTLCYVLQTLFITGEVFAGVFITLRRRRRVTPQQRTQIQFFGYSMLVTISASWIPNFVFIIMDVSSIWTPFLTSFSYFIFALAMWFAITRHQLFHIRSIIARVIAYLASAFLVVVVYAFVVGRSIDEYISSSSLRAVLTGLSLFAAIVVFHRVTTLFNKLTNRVFYREAYSTREAIEQLTAMLVSQLDPVSIVDLSEKLLLKTVRPVSVMILIYDLDSGHFSTRSKDLDATVRAILQLKNQSAAKDPIAIDTASEKVANKMRVNAIQLVIPVYSAKSLEGCIVLGPRLSGEVYSGQDISFLTLAARTIGLALNSAKSYQKVANFNETLKSKVAMATKQLREKNSELERLHKTKDDFISMASHQLRPKITASSGFLELLSRSKDDSKKERSELLDLAKQGMQQMSEIIVDMLDINRMESSELELSKERFDLAALLKSEASSMNKSNGTNRITLRMVSNSSRAYVQADKVKVREVIQNLLSNALQYSHDEVILQLEKEAKWLRVLVIDTGIGLSKAEQKRLFEKFYRSEGAKRIRPTGSGIGLYAARLIIEAHGGAMLVSSVPTKGSSIGFKLPSND